jgi:hypothetical protein
MRGVNVFYDLCVSIYQLQQTIVVSYFVVVVLLPVALSLLPPLPLLLLSNRFSSCLRNSTADENWVHQ